MPVRMLNEYVYCPRLAYLEWVQCEFQDSVDTVEGRYQHRRVDAAGPLLPDPGGDEAAGTLHARSVTLSAVDLGIIARMDLIEVDGSRATPVDYKHGAAPDLVDGVWEPDRIQVAAQALILRANGYDCDRAVVYYVGSKVRVDVDVTADLIARVVELVGKIRAMASGGRIPAPLQDSPKCAGCSLAGICLPDETILFAQAGGATASRGQGACCQVRDTDAVRRLYPILPDAVPVYVQEQGAYVGKKDDNLVIKVKGKPVADVPMQQISHVAVFGGVQVTTAAITELCGRQIPLCYMSHGGWFYGVVQGFGSRNVELRRTQFRRSDDPVFCLGLARRIVWAKIRNQRTLLRRNGSPTRDELRRLDEMSAEASTATGADHLLGIEGNAARLYFSRFSSMLRDDKGGLGQAFRFEGRNRRPPVDPVNAMLSLCYSLLAKDCGIALTAVGFDPFQGFFHTTHHGRQSLALDMMEEFRPIIADSVVLTAINTGEVRESDFLMCAGACNLSSRGRKSLISIYERRMDQVVTHPVFGYKIGYRRLLEVQARLLARHVMGEIQEWPAIVTR